MMMVGLLFGLLLAACCVAEQTRISGTQSIKSKLLSVLNQHGAAQFDDSITDEVAEQIYNQYKLSNRHPSQKPFKFKFGQAKPFPSNQTNTSNKRRKGLTESGWEESDKQTVLDMHNQYRSDVASGVQTDDGTDGTYPTASNMNYLFWDDAIASVAQAYSDTCNWGHNGNRNDEFYSYTNLASFDYPSSNIYMGENIAAMWTSGSVQDSYLTGRVDAWWSEYNLWHYQSYSSSTINGAGHFTQMAWADTRYLGCGFTYCDDSGTTMYYLVCNYYPGGNYLGQYAYTSGTCGASGCDADRTITCQDSLCSGCMDPGFASSGSSSNPSDCSDGFQNVGGGTATDAPTNKPTDKPTDKPTQEPTVRPTTNPTNRPTIKLTDTPTTPNPTAVDDTPSPTNRPTVDPTNKPTNVPTLRPTKQPLAIGETYEPTDSPTMRPSNAPTVPTESPVTVVTGLKSTEPPQVETTEGRRKYGVHVGFVFKFLFGDLGGSGNNGIGSVCDEVARIIEWFVTFHLYRSDASGDGGAGAGGGTRRILMDNNYNNYNAYDMGVVGGGRRRRLSFSAVARSMYVESSDLNVTIVYQYNETDTDGSTDVQVDVTASTNDEETADDMESYLVDSNDFVDDINSEVIALTDNNTNSFILSTNCSYCPSVGYDEDSSSYTNFDLIDLSVETTVTATIDGDNSNGDGTVGQGSNKSKDSNTLSSMDIVVIAAVCLIVVLVAIGAGVFIVKNNLCSKDGSNNQANKNHEFATFSIKNTGKKSPQYGTAAGLPNPFNIALEGQQQTTALPSAPYAANNIVAHDDSSEDEMYNTHNTNGNNNYPLPSVPTSSTHHAPPRAPPKPHAPHSHAPPRPSGNTQTTGHATAPRTVAGGEGSGPRPPPVPQTQAQAQAPAQAATVAALAARFKRGGVVPPPANSNIGGNTSKPPPSVPSWKRNGNNNNFSTNNSNVSKPPPAAPTAPAVPAWKKKNDSGIFGSSNNGNNASKPPPVPSVHVSSWKKNTNTNNNNSSNSGNTSSNVPSWVGGSRPSDLKKTNANVNGPSWVRNNNDNNYNSSSTGGAAPPPPKPPTNSGQSGNGRPPPPGRKGAARQPPKKLW